MEVPEICVVDIATVSVVKSIVSVSESSVEKVVVWIEEFDIELVDSSVVVGISDFWVMLSSVVFMYSVVELGNVDPVIGWCVVMLSTGRTIFPSQHSKNKILLYYTYVIFANQTEM